ncbi:DUF305 domain-containing protein [Lentzea tibetensis]|uniref:DUF305 domain-containing protein n=1 Tax=Lentzea tibetensis TaxID=2591470 RepID=A0A563F1X2_9PSEU|nr:DUF305 domain-containing protein [Lentzea tibetensis]TWP53364.1 DUF305 domain-containing protein [Lentzea tibetensis]
MHARLLVVVISLLALLTSGCSMIGGKEDAVANEADATFSLRMIPHHRQTIEIAKLAPERSTDVFVTGIADQIANAENSEISQMADYLKQWNIQVPGDDAKATHAMAGMLSSKDMEALKAAKGAQFDALFLPTLAKHLRSGIQMAKDAQGKGIHAGSRALAGKIIDSQSAVVDEIAKRGKA